MGIFRGIVAGAAGTTALDAVTYLDMALRARPASSTPQESVQRLADRVGIDLGEGEKADNRKAGAGPLLGYVTGLVPAVAYGAFVRRPLPWPVASLMVAGVAMAVSNAPLTLLGVTDPRRWSAAEWAADVLPHLAYGAVVAAVHDRLR